MIEEIGTLIAKADGFTVQGDGDNALVILDAIIAWLYGLPTGWTPASVTGIVWHATAKACPQA